MTVTPVIATKTLPLVLKAATSNMPVSVTAARPAVAMVTAISNTPRPTTNPDSVPVNLQVANKPAGQDTDAASHILSKNLILVSVDYYLLRVRYYQSNA